MWEFIVFSAKFVGGLLLVLIVYLLYSLIYLPLSIRRKYIKYKNMDVSEKYHPVLGDLAIVMENKNNNRYVFKDVIDCAKFRPEKDIKLLQFGAISQLCMISIKALDQFDKLIPTKIDRYDCTEFPLSIAMKNSFMLIGSDDHWKDRRTSFLKLVGLN